MIRSADIPEDHPSAEARAAWGRARRAEVPRKSHSAWEMPADRADPVAILEAQNADRVQHLVPIRHQRMLVSPFTFYRGSAAIMAGDLVHTPVSGLFVQSCGDAHLANFGVFGSPERALVFDLNDFDETLPGPWEWDLKRLAVSAVLLARDHGWGPEAEQEMVATVGAVYRMAMAQFAQQGRLDVWYARLTDDMILGAISDEKQLRRTTKVIEKARANDVNKAVAKFTEVVNGRRRIKDAPPLIERLDDEFGVDRLRQVHGHITIAFGEYLESIPPDLQYLVGGYQLLDVAVKVVGVGSVGTRCLIALAEGRDPDDLFFFQVKEANRSVLAPYVDVTAITPHGRRVVEGQRLMQAASDAFLGWGSVGGHDYYFRQFRDMKGSFDLDTARIGTARSYLALCAWTLARAHARAGDRIAISAYLGNKDTFERALTKFSVAYADTVEADYAAFRAAADSGRIAVAEGPAG
ncbi:MAG: DUF2252 domain-containing protein [Microthrixaceae bacterium]